MCNNHTLVKLFPAYCSTRLSKRTRSPVFDGTWIVSAHSRPHCQSVATVSHVKDRFVVRLLLTIESVPTDGRRLETVARSQRPTRRCRSHGGSGVSGELWTPEHLEEDDGAPVSTGVSEASRDTLSIVTEHSDMSQSESDQPSDTMRERVEGNRLKRWLLLKANRLLVSTLLVGAVFAVLVVLGTLDPTPLRAAMANSDPVETTFQGLLTAIITGVTLVVTLNQLVLSQELGAVGDQRNRMAEAMQFRQDVEDMIDAPVSPPEPPAFLRALIDSTGAGAEAVVDAVKGSDDELLRDRTTEFADSVEENAEAVQGQLEDTQFGTFDVLFAALNYNYSWKIYEARRIRNTHEDSLSEDAETAFDDLIQALEFFGPAREHFKTLYFRWELVNLSRMILYTAVPALLVSIAMVLYIGNPETIPGNTFGVDNIVWVTSGAVAVAVVPFMLLLSYVLRIATVAKRTLAIGPFILRESERTFEIDWED